MGNFHPNVKDITGQRFGRLVAIKRVDSIGRYSVWECQCDCGNIKNVRLSCLTKRSSKSCGCLRLENGHNVIHGLCGIHYIILGMV